ncbi:hypothetical protein ISG33_07120 [Glaciecola sp. MH2013]|uniref:hypothetical protein n=1 Tax=Glaciecola sp. MH2013 TaxID=2785524 RepID=UPI00189FF983|nr:hypothetical protein [Glaciecola sp. MH2013]MBF7073164.1 hypothetical protein [Glaciecola sp. MH2013]
MKSLASYLLFAAVFFIIGYQYAIYKTSSQQLESLKERHITSSENILNPSERVDTANNDQHQKVDLAGSYSQTKNKARQNNTKEMLNMNQRNDIDTMFEDYIRFKSALTTNQLDSKQSKTELRARYDKIREAIAQQPSMTYALAESLLAFDANSAEFFTLLSLIKSAGDENADAAIEQAIEQFSGLSDENSKNATVSLLHSKTSGKLAQHHINSLVDISLSPQTKLNTQLNALDLLQTNHLTHHERKQITEGLNTRLLNAKHVDEEALILAQLIRLSKNAEKSSLLANLLSPNTSDSLRISALNSVGELEPYYRNTLRSELASIAENPDDELKLQARELLQHEFETTD